MTEFFLTHDLAVQGLALLTLLGVGWMLHRWSRSDPHAKDLSPMSLEWRNAKTLHRKDEHH